MPDARHRVLLIAGIDAVGIARLPSLFARGGYTVDLLASAAIAASKSSYVSKLLPCAKDPHAAARAAREHLAVHRHEYRMIVLADEPTFWAALDLSPRDWLEGWFPVPVTPESLLRQGSKLQFLQDSRDAGIGTPRFEVCRDAEELRAAIEKVGLPVYIKASRGLSGSGVFFTASFAELEGHISAMSFQEPVVAQQEIVGDTVSVSVLYEHGRPVCWFLYKMRNMWPNRFASASSVEFFSHPDAPEIVRQVGELTQFHGLAGIDLMLEECTGKLLLLEFNPRPTPAYYLGWHVGVDFSRALRDCGSGAPQQTPNDRHDVVPMFPQSLYHAWSTADPVLFARTLADAPWEETNLVAAHFRRFMTHFMPESVKTVLKRKP